MDAQPPPEAKSLPDPPSDGITSLSYLPSAPSYLLASTSWDGSIRVHNTEVKSAVLSHAMDSGPLLALATRSGMASVITGGLDGTSK
jgi:WD40 repeat protein